ncbi:hypothetical protein KBC79_07125, partial [Candidatus Woesebacteria bacterium]|nr:hypothetical protein [Candidatus Woesebacteria bacterium]
MDRPKDSHDKNRSLNDKTLQTIQEVTQLIRTNPDALTASYIFSLTKSIQDLKSNPNLTSGTKHQLDVLGENLLKISVSNEQKRQLQSLKDVLAPHLQTARNLLSDPKQSHSESEAWEWYNTVGDLVDQSAKSISPPSVEVTQLLQVANGVLNDVRTAINQGRFRRQGSPNQEDKIARESLAWSQVEQIVRRITAPITDE